MDVLLVGILYLAISLLVGIYTFFRGFLSRPMPHIFGPEDRAIMALTAGLVGLAWIVFMPVQLFSWSVSLFRWLDVNRARLMIRLPGAARQRG